MYQFNLPEWAYCVRTMAVKTSLVASFI